MFKRMTIAVVVLTAAILMFPAPAAAQRFAYDPMEIFFGIGAIRFDVRDLDVPAQTDIGAQVDFTYYFQEKVGVVGEVSWIDADVDLPAEFEPVSRLQGTQISLLGGVRGRFGAGNRFQLRVHGLGGFANLQSDAVISGPGVGVGVPELSGTAFAAAFGGSVDIALHDEVSLRVQPDVLITTHSSNATTSFRLAFGVVF